MEADLMAADSLVRARIDQETKARATAVLEDMGLSVSDAIRLLMIRIADERRLPFAVTAPKEKTRRAIANLEAGKGDHFSSIDDLMADLNADD
jgi:DNA-damage-inducible protein J